MRMRLVYLSWVPVPQALQHFVRMLSQLTQKTQKKQQNKTKTRPFYKPVVAIWRRPVNNDVYSSWGTVDRPVLDNTVQWLLKYRLSQSPSLLLPLKKFFFSLPVEKKTNKTKEVGALPTGIYLSDGATHSDTCQVDTIAWWAVEMSRSTSQWQYRETNDKANLSNAYFFISLSWEHIKN